MCTLQKKFLLLDEVEAGGRCRIQNRKIGQRLPRTKPNSKICFPPWAVSQHLVTCELPKRLLRLFVEVGLRVAMDVEDGLEVVVADVCEDEGVVDFEDRGLKTILKPLKGCRSKYSLNIQTQLKFKTLSSIFQTIYCWSERWKH